MTVHHTAGNITVHAGDALDVLAALPDNSAHAVITDPPYGMEFTGTAGTVLHDPTVVGGYQDGNGGNAYSRSRIRYGRDRGASAAFGDWCTQWTAHCLRILKPGGHLVSFGGTRTWHRLAVAVEDNGFEMRDNVAWLYASGFPKSLNLTDDTGDRTGWGTALKPSFEPIIIARKPLAGNVADTVAAHGTGALNIDAARSDGRWPPNAALDPGQADELDSIEAGASRFFYASKPDAGQRVRIDGVAHPTVKPLDLMRWLVRLVTPPGGTVVEPFAGSGTTVEACLLEGMGCVAVEREPEYLPLIVQRINRRTDPVAAVRAAGDDAGLFDLL